MVEPERREFQRLHLTKPLEGWFGQIPVRLMDVSAIGALMEHEEGIAVGTTALLRFSWRGNHLILNAEVVRGGDGQSGLFFLDASPLLRELIAQSATEVLRAQQANLDGQRELNVVGDETLTAASAGLRGKGYVTYTFDNGTWTQRKSLLPDQPPNGFTVPAGESQEQIDMLCMTYQNGNEQSRSMTRLLAELSVANARQSAENRSK